MIKGKKICLASDNWSPAHPLIMDAIMKANEGCAPSYGADSWTEHAAELIKHEFKNAHKIYIVPNGTGANVFGLRLLVHRYESVICTDIAHIHYQESGAPEAIIGSKLLPTPHSEGKILPDAISKKLRSERAFGKHSTSPKVVAITQPTEVGTVYTALELKAISKLCQEEGLFLHVDGSRLYNAAAYLKSDLYGALGDAQVDILSLGGTKNGLMGAEALVIFNEDVALGSDYLQKQTLQLMSKMRYLSAQYIPFLADGLWRKLALNANLRAQEIAAIIKRVPGISISYPVETNQIFFSADRGLIPRIQDAIDCYLWDQELAQIRFIASWMISDHDVKNLEKVFKAL